MKNLFKFLITAVAIAATVMSCGKDPVGNGGGPVEPPIEPPVDTITMVESPAKTSEGISLKAMDISDQDFTLVMDMGLDCPSYIFDAMPYARFQNFLLEARKTNPNLTEDDFIKNTLFAKDGSGGYNMAISFEDSYDDSKYSAQAQIVHGIEYIVFACACSGASPSSDAVVEINKLIVPLKQLQVEGDPKVEVKCTEETYANVNFTFTMNDDCYSFYYISFEKEAIDEVYAALGEKRFRELICCMAKGPEAADNNVNIRPGFNGKAGQVYTTYAIGMDSNGTLASNYTQASGTLQVEKPQPPAKYTSEIVYASAMTIRAHFDIDWNVTHAVFYRVYTESAWNELSKLTGDDARELKLNFINGGANGINYTFRNNANALIWGEVCDVTSNVPFKDNTKYYLVSFGNNKGTALTDFDVKEVTTKPLSWDENLSEAKVSAKLVESTKSTVKLDFTIPEAVTLYWDSLLEDGSKDYKTGIDLTDPANAEVMKKWLLTDGNVTRPDLEAPTWTYASLDAGKKYCHFIVAEDENGVIGPMTRIEIDTKQNIGGPNPGTDIQYTVTKTASGGYSWNVRFEINNETLHHRYMIIDDKELTTTTPENRVQAWTNMVMGDLAIKSISSSTLKKTVSAFSNNMVALSIPFGFEDGAEKRGTLAYVVFDPAWITSALLPAKAYAQPTNYEISASVGKRMARK